MPTKAARWRRDRYPLSYAWILSYAGRTEDALAAMDRAMRLNPRPPASYLEVLGEIHFVAGKYDESVSAFRRVLDINPNYMRARMWIAAVLAHTGSLDSAQWGATQLRMMYPDFTLSQLQFAFPFKNPRQLDALLEGLKKAGITD